ncbi:MAG: 30S ribosomal protein S20 [Spirochaetaceae bacterium]|nr:MAG: 30S ribosomal protein S20 [Spirochaetaceae bacterium]
MTKVGSAAKRHRQSEKRRVRNRSVRSQVRTGTRKFLEACQANEKENAQQRYLELTKLIDSAASKGIYPRNNAARKKSRLHKKLNAVISSQ